jgi:hypothetical protein
MVDPITALHLVATVGSEAVSFIEKAYKVFQTIKSIKDAPKHARELVTEISSVASLIPQLQDVLTDSLEADLDTFKSMLVALNSKMRVLERQTPEQLKWPFTKSETQEKILKIGRYKETFNLAITAAMA